MNDLNENRRIIWPYVFGSLLGVSLALIIISGVLFFRSSQGNESAPAEPLFQNGERTGTSDIDVSRENAIVTATRIVAPAVVGITIRYTRTVRGQPQYRRGRSWYWELFVPEVQKEFENFGSGVIISPDGFILTNAHVITGANDIEVTLSDGRNFGAQVVGIATDYDIALVKVQGTEDEKLPYASLGDSDEVVVGEWAIAIGQPFGQYVYDSQPTVTVGVISALHRDVKGPGDGDLADLIQTDASINPGNSGGPLINADGEVIGVNTYVFSTAGGGSIGMGFAIPINRGKYVLEEFRDYGRVRSVWVGLTVKTLTPQLATAIGLEHRSGLLVREIEHGSPAEQAGLELGDLILGIDGVKVVSIRRANHLMFRARIDDTLIFEVERDGKTRTFEVTLEERPDEEI